MSRRLDAEVAAKLRIVRVDELTWARCFYCPQLIEATPGWYIGWIGPPRLALSCEACAAEHWPSLLAELHAARYGE